LGAAIVLALVVRYLDRAYRLSLAEEGPVGPPGVAVLDIFSLGLVKGLFGGIVGGLVGMVLTVVIRGASGMEPWSGPPVSAIASAFGLFGFLIGVGAFADWAKWAVGIKTGEHPHHDPDAPHWIRYFNFDGNHKIIGVQYGVTSILLMLIAGLFALIFRAELAQPDLQFLQPQGYNTLMSLHGMVMIASILVGIGAVANYLVPLLIGAQDMAFPRLNAFSYWLLPPGAVLLLLSLATGGFDTGWTGYPPLSAQANLGVQFFFLGVYVVGLSSIVGSINLIVTILMMRAPGMTLWRMPIFVWGVLATSIIQLTATQFIGLSFLMVTFQRLLGMGFFDPANGGKVILFQHLFWFYSHPAVYIFVLPGLGIISELLPVFARKPLFGYKWIALSSMAIAILGFLVWAHHMFVSGMPVALRIPFMVSTLFVAVPTGVKFFSWLGTMWGGRMTFETPMLFVLGAFVVFLLGGLSGPPLGLVVSDLHLHDTYFVVAHFHHTMFGGYVFPFMAAIYYWFPKITGRMYSERLGKLHFWLMTIGFYIVTLSMFRMGLLGMRRRIADYDPALGIDGLHMAATLGGYLVGLSVLIFAVNLWVSARRGAKAPVNPWNSRSLEWQISSPPPENNYDVPPIVDGDPYDYGVPGAPAYVTLGMAPSGD
jgi:cytochrome c oxidase subunit 1